MQGMALDAKGPQTNWGHLKFSFCTFFDSVQFLLASSKVEFVRITEAEKQALEGTILFDHNSKSLVGLTGLPKMRFYKLTHVLQILQHSSVTERAHPPQDISQLFSS